MEIIEKEHFKWDQQTQVVKYVPASHYLQQNRFWLEINQFGTSEVEEIQFVSLFKITFT